MSLSNTQNSSNSSAFVHAQQYSNFILENLHDGLLPGNFYRDVSDFTMGTVIDIKTIGSVTLQEVSEMTPLTYNPIDTGSVQLRITDYVGDAYAISDILRQDGAQIDQLMAMRAMEGTRAMQEYFETRLFETANAGQVAGDENVVNGFAHRVVASGTNQTIELQDLINMRLAFDKANVPMAGRVLVVDPIVAATLNTKFNAGYQVDRNPEFMAMMKEGFDRDHQFVMNLFGWNIVTSNRLPKIAAETVNAVAVTDGVANICMSLADDNTKPVMHAWRQMPAAESKRNVDKRQDEFVVTARDGWGVQRTDSLGVILTSSTAIA